MSIEEQTIANEEKLLEAFQKCDLNVIENFLHDDALFVYPNGLLFTKENVLDNYRSAVSAFSSIISSEQVIKIIDDTVTVSVVMELSGKYKEQIINDKFRYIRVWKIFNDGWKVIATSGVQL